MDKKIVCNPINVTTRIDDTKKEIAMLSEELEKLIYSNVTKRRRNDNHGSHINQEDNISNNINKNVPQLTEDNTTKLLNENEVNSNNKINIVNTVIKNNSKIPEKINKKETLCSKTRRYDKEAAKEYIKQQREKREEQRKVCKSKTKVDLELRKQKLYELQQKSLALVQRNVQMKRERSKSRENRSQIIFDRKPVYSSKKNLPDRKVISAPVLQRNKSPQVVRKQVSNTKSATHSIPKQKIVPPTKDVRTPFKNITLRSENIPVNPTELCPADMEYAATKIQSFYRGYRLRNQIREKLIEKSKPSIKTENSFKESKETQTNLEKPIETPFWLQPSTVSKVGLDPYPCNFISTIKKKLQGLMNSEMNSPIKLRDVGVGTSKSYEIKDKFESKKFNGSASIEKNDLKSFLSHRCTNLDGDALKHLALIHNQKQSGKILTNIRTDSDSDTCKNIPDISTESDNGKHIINNRNTSFLLIDTEKIENLRLKNPLVKDDVVSLKNSNQRSYTLDFEDDVKSQLTPKRSRNENDDEKSSKSPRDSIISFNTSGYNIYLSPLNVEHNNEPTSARTSPISEKDKTVSPKHSISNIPKDLILKKRSESTESEIKENIEKSLNTSLISHISDGTSSVSLDNYGNKEKSKESIISFDKFNFSDKDSSTSIPRSVEFNEMIKSDHVKKSTESSIHTNFTSEMSDSSQLSSQKNKKNSLQNITEREHKLNKSFELKTDHNFLKPIIPNKSNSTESIRENVLSIKSNSSRTKNDGSLISYSDKSTESLKSACSKEFVSLISSKFPSEKTNFESKLSSEKEIENIDVSGVKPIENSNSNSSRGLNNIHSKFEKEMHLLNDFNDSLRQFMAVEKVFESIKNKSEHKGNRSYDQNIENSKNSSKVTLSEDSKISVELSKSIVSSINISRGTDFEETYENMLRRYNKSIDSTELEVSNVGGSNTKNESKVEINDPIPNNLAGLSIKMFEQLICDEDVRIENLKTVIKIREQALLDRTKGELAWLEIQRKHLKETGKLHEASLVKKKQRGILLKHQQERREMQRLKQLQKIQSNERKTILNEQKNLIKAKLHSEKFISELKMHTPRKRKSTGPLKVLKSSESVHSETSISKKGSDGEEVFSITSRSRSIRLSEIESNQELILNDEETDIKMIGDNENVSKMKRALFIRQAALMKRRKTVEDLLERHRKLLEEEKKIEELEMAANTIIMQMPTLNQSKSSNSTKLRIRGQKLNEIGIKTGAFTEKKFLDNRTYSLSQTSYEKLLTQATNYRMKHKKTQLQEITDNPNHNESISDSVINNLFNNTEPQQNKSNLDDIELCTQELENDVVSEVDENNLSSISELIQDFSKIEHGISMMSKQYESTNVISHKSNTSSENLSESLKEPSVIETNKTSPRTNNTISNIDELVVPPILSKNDTFETVNDEDVSEIIHKMIPSSSNSESSFNLGEIEKEFESKNQISESPNEILSEIETESQPSEGEYNINVKLIENIVIKPMEIQEPHNIIKETVEIEEISSEPLNNSYSEEFEENVKITEISSEIQEISGKKSLEDIENGVISSESEISMNGNVNIYEISERSITPVLKDIISVEDVNELIPSTKSTVSEILNPESASTDSNKIKDVPEEITPETPSITEKKSTVQTHNDTDYKLTFEEVSEDYSEKSANEVNDLKEDSLKISGITEECYSIISRITECHKELSTSKTEELSTDISEKLSSDVENQQSTGSSVHYTDDFEDDDKEDSPEDLNNSGEKSNFEKIDSEPERKPIVVVINERSNKNSNETLQIPEIKLNNETVDFEDFNESSEDSEISEVKKRVSEILASTVDSPKSPKDNNVQNYYVTTYEDVSPVNSPESVSPSKYPVASMNIFGNEAQELLKKQLAIEQEIKHLEQQQKEQLPFVFIREIPNKPPPPYTPPSIIANPVITILPSKVEELKEICNYSAKVLYNAYLSNNLNGVTFSQTDFNSINQTKSSKDCCLFVFDICREVAKDHYKKFEKENVPLWLKVPENSKLSLGKPFGYPQLEKYINTKVKELLGFEKSYIKDNSIIKWNKKKKDHVDEILAIESQLEENEWVNYDKDELIVKNEVTNQILDILLIDTIEVFRRIFS